MNQKTSLRSKLLWLLCSAMLLTLVIASGVNFYFFHRNTISEHAQLGKGVAALAAA